MCGIAGLFVGCPAIAICPSVLAPERDGAEPEYHSVFGSWFERGGVRRAPRRVLDEDQRKHVFSPDLVPLAQHELVRALPPAVFDAVLTQHLYRYLHFTVWLEHLVVNRTVLGIAHGGCGVDLPDEMVLDAYKIYCDEAYHAVAAADLLRQVRDRTGIRSLATGRPYFATRLAEIQESVAPELRTLVELLFVICSETLISATLADVPDDGRVHAAVRETIRDHAQDEGRHHAYFAEFLRFLWGRLDRSVRRAAALVVPDLVLAFLRPDLPAMRTELRDYGLTTDATEQVLAEVFHPGVIDTHARATARHTVRHFASVGALDDPAARDRFAELGLLQGETP